MTLPLPDWLDPYIAPLEPWLPWITGIGIVMALLSMLAIPWLLVRMPVDYFNTPSRPVDLRGPLAWLGWLLRNLFALLLLLAGIAMLILPGQGMLTIIIALMISTFPGKYRLERAIIRRRGVLRAVNWIRERYHRPPLEPPRASQEEVDQNIGRQ